MALKPCTGSGRKIPVMMTTSPGFILRQTSPRRWMEMVRGVAPSGTWGVNGDEFREAGSRGRSYELSSYALKVPTSSAISWSLASWNLQNLLPRVSITGATLLFLYCSVASMGINDRPVT